MPSNEILIQELVEIILESTGLHSVNRELIDREARLNEAPFNLDSIDILEVVAAVENKYKVQVRDARQGAEHFQSLSSIAAFISTQGAT